MPATRLLLLYVCVVALAAETAIPTSAGQWKKLDEWNTTFTVPNEGEGGGPALKLAVGSRVWQSWIQHFVSYPRPIGSFRVRLRTRYDSVTIGNPWETGSNQVRFLTSEGDELVDYAGPSPRPTYGDDFYSGTSGWRDGEMTGSYTGTSTTLALKLGTYLATGTVWWQNVRIEAWDRSGVAMSPSYTGNGDGITTDTTGWLPFAPGAEDTTRPQVIDLARFLDAPAGRHGRLRVVGDRFEFADGTPARFYGTGSPDWGTSHAEIDRRVDGLARLGINLARLHALDGDIWMGTSLVQDGDTWSVGSNAIDPAKWELLDYYIARCKARGIHLFIDFNAKKKIRGKDLADFGIVDDARGAWASAVWDWGGNRTAVQEGVKAVCMYSTAASNPGVTNLMKAWTRQLLEHVNPYTGLAYKDDPVFVMAELANENNGMVAGDYANLTWGMRDIIAQQFRVWCGANGVAWSQYDETTGGWKAWNFDLCLTNRDPNVYRFVLEKQDAWYADMRAFVRTTLGCPIVLAGSNWQMNAGDLVSQSRLDYIDHHFYWDVPQGGYVPTSYFHNKPHVRSLGKVAEVGRISVAGRPYSISEYDFDWPNEWCSEGEMTMAAFGCFQGVDQLSAFIYHGDGWGAKLDDSWHHDNKPHKVAGWVAGALLWHRQDVVPCADSRRLAMETDQTDNDVHHAVSPAQFIARRIAFVPPGGGATDALPAEPVADGAGFIRSVDGQLTWKADPGVLAIDTARTQGVLGFWSSHATADVALTASTGAGFSQVIVTSLDDLPIASSARLLVTTTARCENTGQAYHIFKRGLSAVGTGPILFEPITATVRIAQSVATTGTPAAWAVDWHGRRTGVALPLVANGDGSFTLTIANRAFGWFEVVLPKDPLPTVTIAASDAAASEPAETGTFTLTRTGVTTAALTVALAASGTAGAGDYGALPGTVTFAIGQSTATVTVTPINDTLVEPAETVIATLSAGAGYVLGSPSSATVTIADDDVAAATVTIAASDAAASEPAATGTFTVTRTGVTTAALTVALSASGTAGAGDYAALPATVTFASGQSTATVTVTPIDDALVEPAETVIATLSAGAGYTVGSPSSATVTIADDDVATATVTIAVSDANGSEAGDAVAFTVTRSGSTTADLVVNLGRGGTALVADAAVAATLTIAAGQVSAVLTIMPVDDAWYERSETLIVRLLAGAGYALGGASEATATLVSDDPLVVTSAAPTGAQAGTAMPGGLTTNAEDPGLLTSTWTWGDGSSASTITGIAGSHAYAAPGTYAVTVSVSDPTGGPTATSSYSVVVSPAAPAASAFAAGGGGDGGCGLGSGLVLLAGALALTLGRRSRL